MNFDPNIKFDDVLEKGNTGEKKMINYAPEVFE